MPTTCGKQVALKGGGGEREKKQPGKKEKWKNEKKQGEKKWKE